MPTVRRFRSRAVAPAVAAAALLATAVGIQPAGAVPSAHPTGGHTTTCYGKVLKVDDGDTVEVRLLGHCFTLRKGDRMVVRNAGIQATEHGKPGECWWTEARDNFAHLMHHGARVRLQSYHSTRADDRYGKVRYLKYMDVQKRINGRLRWVDVQLSQLQLGLAMWKPQEKETARNASYRHAMVNAMDAHLGMWGDPTHCSMAYAPNADLQTWIGWKTDGADNKQRASQEWVRILNRGNNTVNLSHWMMRDSSHGFFARNKTYFTFPSGTHLAPGAYLTLFPNSGPQDPESLTFHDDSQSNRLPFWRNAHMAGRAAGAHSQSRGKTPLGGEVFLVDPAKDFRSWAVYPCIAHCSFPNLRITSVQPRGPDEQVVITNTSGSPQDVTGVVLEANGMRVEMVPGTVLQPNQSVRVYCDRSGQDTATKLFWKHAGKSSMLSDGGGTLWLRTWDDVTIDTASWGNGGNFHY
ncbi:MAG: lamin tail domain-containing protein [Frankiales bacterium]|nr:lamin tail domain-containing protein [Frankiales bacterium]